MLTLLALDRQPSNEYHVSTPKEGESLRNSQTQAQASLICIVFLNLVSWRHCMFTMASTDGWRLHLHQVSSGQWTFRIPWWNTWFIQVLIGTLFFWAHLLFVILE
jgi:hypothetical protein